MLIKEILGDSDQVALAMEKAGDVHPEADWKVETGSNVLVNVATIVDVDSTGTTYVGGDHYSDEILFRRSSFHRTTVSVGRIRMC